MDPRQLVAHAAPAATHHVHVAAGWWLLLAFIVGVVAGVVLTLTWDVLVDWLFETVDTVSRWLLAISAAVGVLFLVYAAGHWWWHIL